MDTMSDLPADPPRGPADVKGAPPESPPLFAVLSADGRYATVQGEVLWVVPRESAAVHLSSHMPGSRVVELVPADALTAERERAERAEKRRDEARGILNQCWDAAGLLAPRKTGVPGQAWEVSSNLVPRIDDLNCAAASLDDAESEVGELKRAIARAIESAEAEGVHRHRGTDDPREFITILRSAAGLGPAAARGEGAKDAERT